MKEISFIVFVLSITFISCTQKKNIVEQVVTDELSKEIEKPVEDIPKAQLELVRRTAFNRNVLSYDTTTLKNSDTIPIRLMHELDSYHRIPGYKMIAGRKMRRNGIGYEYKDKEWHIKTKYPGVVGYFPRHWGDYAKKIEYYDENGQLLRILDFDKLTPYASNSFKHLTPGGFNFESMEVDEEYESANYIKDALALKEDRTILLLKNNDWVVANYQLLALGELNRVIGYESTLVVYNKIGEIQYSEKLPFSVGKTFISTDQRYLVYAPRRAKYMMQNDTLKGELFVVDLAKREKIFTQYFDNENVRNAGCRESTIENVLRCNFKSYNKLEEEKYHFFIDLPKEAVFKINKNKIKSSPKGKYDSSTKGLLLKNFYQYKEF